jgi:cob(I)alamin adenosyltransferase
MSKKIYTKTGDRGQTSLFGGLRLPKSHLRIDSYGTIDELNSYLGLVRDHMESEVYKNQIKYIQDRLFTVGSHLASDPKKDLLLPDLGEEDIHTLELSMDEMNKELPELKNFIIPGGDRQASFLHVARCVCRRAERRVVALSIEDEVEEIIIRYLNRLSDYLFVLSRYVAMVNGAVETQWIPKNVH